MSESWWDELSEWGEPPRCEHCGAEMTGAQTLLQPEDLAVCDDCLPIYRPDGLGACPDPAEQWAFEAFAAAHPHEVHAEWPERFWEFFRRNRPGVSREEMERELAATDTKGHDG